MQVVVASLVIRVKQLDVDERGKLCRVLRYLKGAKYMKLTLTIDHFTMIRWWGFVILIRPFSRKIGHFIFVKKHKTMR